MRAAGLLFIVNAFLLTCWAIKLPYFKALLQIDDGQLGLALLSSPLGVILASPFASEYCSRTSPGRASFSFALLTTLLIGGFYWVDNYSSLVIILFLFGVMHGSMDVAINAYINVVESTTNTSIMSISHGFWSLGAAAGALIGSLLSGWEVSIGMHLLIHIGTCLLLLLILLNQLSMEPEQSNEKTKWSIPPTTIIGLAAFVFIVFMMEGALADWSSIYYREILGSTKAQMGIGFAAFSTMMAISRFQGDVVLERYPHQKIALISASMLSILLMGFVLSSSLIWSTILLAGIGLFCSVLVPLVFQAAARTPGVSGSQGIAYVAALGYGGFLCGPPVIGLLSRSYGLRSGFILLAILLGAAALYWLIRVIVKRESLN